MCCFYTTAQWATSRVPWAAGENLCAISPAGRLPSSSAASPDGGAKGKIAGRGVAMTADTSPCDYCGKQGHHVRICRYKSRDDNSSTTEAHDKKPQNKKLSGGKAGAKGAAGQKWCSLHKTTSHSDEGCYEQGAPRPERTGAHLASAVLTAGSPPVNDNENPSLPFDDDFEFFIIIFIQKN